MALVPFRVGQLRHPHLQQLLGLDALVMYILEDGAFVVSERRGIGSNIDVHAEAIGEVRCILNQLSGSPLQ